MRNEVLEKMNSIETIFAELSEKHEAYKPEFEGVRKIRLELEKGELTSRIETIIRIYNDTNEKVHQSGYYWRDYRGRLQYLLATEQITVLIERHTGRMGLKKSGPPESLAATFPFSIN
jgi:hypothetical protein